MRQRLRVCQAYDPEFHRTSRAYDVLGPALCAEVASWHGWPDVSLYDGWAGTLAQQAGRALVFRDVPRAHVLARGGYDRFIHETDQIPTRSGNWHDFFNACIWARLPGAKLAVHRAQLAEGTRRTGPTRTRRQDWLTHFDECGVVLVSDSREVLARIAALDWRRVFVAEREAFMDSVRVVCFGHAILEALREPYVGLMGKALLCHDPCAPGSERLALAADAASERALARLDGWLAQRLSAPELPRLCALPVLGVPGWHAPNERRSFYDQPHYFRTHPAATRGDGRPQPDALGPADARSRA